MKVNPLLVILTLSALVLLGFEEWRPRGRALDRHAPMSVQVLTNAPAMKAAGAESDIKRLDWAGLESTDYREYIANLKKVGCPGQTIRDIIAADVSSLYLAKRKELLASNGGVEYWRQGSSPGDMVGEELKGKLAALDVERRRVLRQLLGVEPPPDSGAANLTGAELNTVAMAFLPEGKREAVIALVNEADATYRSDIMGRSTSDGDAFPKAYKDWKAARAAKVGGLLSAEEMEQFDLRFSPVASLVRFKYGGMKLSEAEFREVVRFGSRYEDSLDLRAISQAEAAAGAKYAEAAALLAAKVQEITGKKSARGSLSDPMANKYGFQ